MNNIVKLETSINKFIEEFDELQVDRDNAIKDAESAKDELKKTQETINDLKLNIIKTESETNYNIEDRKNEIIKQIKLVISRVEKLKIDDITNV